MIVTVDHEKLFRAFQDARKELFYVGGCVRDSYTNTPTHDVDFATNATPEEVIKLLSIYDSNIRILPTGIKFGTVTALMPSGVGYEITTYRNEGRYEDGRHPTEVTYSETLQEDLSRRDFTCNAMAYTLPDNLIDPYNGLQDIQSRVIRCVGCADDRFNEDKLRVIRCLRFALRYEWDIEDTTFEAALRHASGLQKVSKERLGKELTEILSSEFNKNLPAKTLTLLQKILSEVSGATDEVVKRVITLYNPLLRWFVLFSHKVTSNDISSLTEFAVNSDVTAGVKALCKADEFIDTNSDRPLLKQVLNIVTTYPERLALLEGLHDYPELYLNITDSIVKNLPVSILDLKISGNDVIRVCGVSGKAVRDILQSCLNYVCRYPQHNTYNDLIEYIKDFRNEY